MPQWLVIAVIGLVWALLVIAIIVFMMGASRSRRKQREHERTLEQRDLAKK